MNIYRILLLCFSALIFLFIYQPATGQHIYFSKYPGSCWFESDLLNQPDSLNIYVHAPDHSDIVGAYFRFETGYFGPEDVIYFEPVDGVEITDGELFQGITLSWSPVSLEHYPVLKMIVTNNPPHVIDEPHSFCVMEPILFQSVGDTLTLYHRICTFLGHLHCYEPRLQWSHPDTVDIEIGSQSIVEVKWIMDAAYTWGTYIDVSDENSWVVDFFPNGVWAVGCPACDWHWQIIQITVEVPQDTPDYALSRMTIQPEQSVSPTSLYLRAVPPISTKKQTWGEIKKLFKDN